MSVHFLDPLMKRKARNRGHSPVTDYLTVTCKNCGKIGNAVEGDKHHGYQFKGHVFEIDCYVDGDSELEL